MITLQLNRTSVHGFKKLNLPYALSWWPFSGQNPATIKSFLRGSQRDRHWASSGIFSC
ncbi:hypothetical protein JG687_00019664 [Phytophthora cactorum]|uniref:Uncharacterized protein n=1 Tax=Phytophthora cactorum TaxID=29920 RepID=A0A8T1TJG0_9STRA|nr:hypothetical protein JG687_00019664 [Phytophthora cactorum]